MKIWRATNPGEKTDGADDVLQFKGKPDAQQLKDDRNHDAKDDTRNDAPAVERKEIAKTRKKKKNPKITVGRNNSYDAPRETPEKIGPPMSKTLSSLLFSKQNMEQRDQMKVVYRQFGPDAEDVLVVEKDDGMPSPEETDHVVVKVQVRTIKLRELTTTEGWYHD